MMGKIEDYMRAKRVEMGYSLDDLARMFGMNKSNISAIENGKYVFYVKYYKLFLDFLPSKEKKVFEKHIRDRAMEIVNGDVHLDKQPKDDSSPPKIRRVRV